MANSSRTRTRDLSPADRAVYHLVERGGIDSAHAALYRRQLGALARAGLVLRHPDGSYEAVPSRASTAPPAPADAAPTYVPPPPRAAASWAPTPSPFPAPRTFTPPPAEPKDPPMATLVARVPQAWLDAIDAAGVNRSEGLRAILGKALAASSGARRKVG